MIKRFFEIKKESGIKVAVAKAVKYAPVLILKNIGQRLFQINSQRYWDYRLLFNWTSAGGDKQTQDFAESFIENVDRSFVEFDSILDFGCALGDSASVFRRLNDDLEIYLWDISEVGLSKAIKRNQNSRVIRWDKTKKVELNISNKHKQGNHQNGKNKRNKRSMKTHFLVLLKSIYLYVKLENS